MSEHEQHAVIGRLVSEYLELKRSRELRRAVLMQNASELRNVAERLSAGAFENAATLLRKQIVEDLGLQRIEALVAEFMDLDRKVSEAKIQLEKLDVKID